MGETGGRVGEKGTERKVETVYRKKNDKCDQGLGKREEKMKG